MNESCLLTMDPSTNILSTRIQYIKFSDNWEDCYYVKIHILKVCVTDLVTDSYIGKAGTLKLFKKSISSTV